MRFKIGNPVIPARRFRLPEGEHSTPPAPLPELYKPVTPHVWGAGVARQTYKRPVEAQTPKRTSRRPVEAQMGAGGLYTAKAPVGPRKGRTILDFVCATDSEMPAFMGTIKLEITADSVDLSRLENGLLSLCVDHDTSALMGRITEGTIYPGRLDMLAEVGDTPTATNAMAEIDDLMRLGFSPGFLIHRVRILDDDDDSYDPDQYMQIVCEKWEPFECSSSAIPRNRDAKLKGVASMNSDAIIGAPELVHTSDLVGLSLAAARKALDSSTGSERQRAKLTEFFKVYEKGRERGLARDEAATAAKLETGI